MNESYNSIYKSIRIQIQIQIQIKTQLPNHTFSPPKPHLNQYPFPTPFTLSPKFSIIQHLLLSHLHYPLQKSSTRPSYTFPTSPISQPLQLVFRFLISRNLILINTYSHTSLTTKIQFSLFNLTPPPPSLPFFPVPENTYSSTLPPSLITHPFTQFHASFYFP